MAGPPELAVVVGAFEREEFLARAVRSVVAQTLPRDRFELIVVKSFRPEAIDRELADLGATVLLDGSAEAGRFLRRGVAAARAPWVAFLDDDDEFEPDRLERIVEVVRAHPDLGLYRNRVRVIDRDGRPVPVGRWRRLEVDAAYDRLGEVYLPAGRKGTAFATGALHTWSTFNSSTMAIRRDLLDGDLGSAFERQTLPDTFLFLAGVVGPGGLFLDPRRLTRYRSWDASATRSPRWFEAASRSEEELAAVATRYGEREFARWFASRAVHYRRMEKGARLAGEIAGRGERRAVAHLAADYLRFLGGHPAERRLSLDAWAAGFYGLSYALFPGPIRGLAEARITDGHRG
jgi:glycosyltransferase involved in cell wall biosynthesis